MLCVSPSSSPEGFAAPDPVMSASVCAMVPRFLLIPFHHIELVDTVL